MRPAGTSYEVRRSTRAAVACVGLLALVACRPPVPEARAPDRAEPVQVVLRRPHGVPNPMVLGLMPVLEPEGIRERYAALAAYLGDTLGTTVELSLAADYPSAIQRAAAGEVDVAQLSPLAYVDAKLENPNLYPLVANISEGSSTYSAYLMARRSGVPIRGVEDIAGRKLGFVDPSSASGYLYPYAFLLERGVDPSRDCEFTLFKRHDRVLEALVAGSIDVGATFSGALIHAERAGLDTSDLEIVAKTGRIPHDAWVARPTLDPEVHDAIRQALLQLSTATQRGRKILAAIDSINAFTVVDDTHYDRVRDVRSRVPR